MKRYRAKCIWRSTSMNLIIEAKDEEEAWKKASNYVLRLEGGAFCLDIKVTELSA